jgi:ribosome biogenesis GTPase
VKKGIVIKSTGSWYIVKNEEGKAVQCRIKGKFRMEGFKLTNPVAVGDEVEMEMEDEEIGIIKKILPRKNYVMRQSPRKKHSLHLLASNVDQAILIITIIEPNLKQGFIDRFLLMTEPYDIPTLIVFNKADLLDEGQIGIYEYLKEIYNTIGYECMLISALTGEGVDELKTILKGKTTLLAGQSGVGKSSMMNALQADFGIKVQDLSDSTGKGQHTTTFAEMFDLDDGGAIIDTPGIKTLSFSHLEPMDVAHNFREFFEYSSECKFGGSCLHRNEPGCAVKDAIEKEEISELRYINYLTILEEIEDQNYWERHKDY